MVCLKKDMSPTPIMHLSALFVRVGVKYSCHCVRMLRCFCVKGSSSAQSLTSHPSAAVCCCVLLSFTVYSESQTVFRRRRLCLNHSTTLRTPQSPPCCRRSSTDSPPSPSPPGTGCPSSRLQTPFGSCAVSAASRSCSLHASSSASLRGHLSSAGCGAVPPPGRGCSCTLQSHRHRSRWLTWNKSV